LIEIADAVIAGDYHRVQYWLQSIHAKAKGAPIIVVGTKQDLCTTTHVNETFVKMQAQFANFGVRKFMSVSCWTGKGIPELKQFILETALKQRTMGEQIPKIYLELEKTSEKKKTELAGQKKPPTVTYDEMRAIALAIPRLDDEEELNRAIEFLHELGSLVYFKKPGLSDIVILDPRWLTDVMVRIEIQLSQII
jgi:tRNA U34 5-carboxymethylaminomethyl modifying GTPase MnmE/TrmE